MHADNSARCGSAYVAARGVDGGLVRSADKDQCLARCQKDKKHDQSTGSKPLAAQPSSAHLQIFAAKQPPMLHEQQAIRSKVVEFAGTMLTAEGKAKVDQILANLYSSGQENVEPSLSDNDVHPLGLLMDAAALSKAPLVLAGLQELSRVPTILSDGRFKNLVMANSLTPGTFHCLACVLSQPNIMSVYLDAHQSTVMAQGTPQPGHQTGSSTGVVPAAPGKTRTEDQQGTLQSMESGHPDQESRKLSESHAAQVLLKMQTATAQVQKGRAKPHRPAIRTEAQKDEQLKHRGGLAGAKSRKAEPAEGKAKRSGPKPSKAEAAQGEAKRGPGRPKKLMKAPCRRSSKKAEPKAKKRRLCKGDQKCKAKAVAIMSAESEQEAESEDETESEDDPETYSSHEEDTDN
ncbi:TPA: hypothetical protein ACH3X1_013320 [Trebouxia sp. C0004]